MDGGAHLLPDGGGKVGNIQLQRVQGGSQLGRNACQGLKEALVEEESSMELAQALCLGTEPKYQGVVPSHPPGPRSPPNTHQLLSLAGAAAQRGLRDTQRVAEQHQLLRVAQFVGSTL
ncbi:hypothetical protein U0070_023530 [Myodes glareolus]|uniref:Uncharacterized protein n=1 Tax=Myodes glareolus TaxID=447135 RepID=A0AAW0HI48_MYOGA